MKKQEIKGLLKGLGVGMILSAAIFYGMLLNLRMAYESSLASNDEVIVQAKELGMVFRSDLGVDYLNEEALIEEAKRLGMVFEEELK